MLKTQHTRRKPLYYLGGCFKRPKFADAIIITTPDNLHYGPCMKALEMGYDVLLEKPISPSEKECRDILSLAKKPAGL